MPDEYGDIDAHGQDEVRYEEHRERFADDDEIVECSECGHLHYNVTVGVYDVCPLCEEDDPCPHEPRERSFG